MKVSFCLKNEKTAAPGVVSKNFRSLLLNRLKTLLGAQLLGHRMNRFPARLFVHRGLGPQVRLLPHLESLAHGG